MTKNLAKLRQALIVLSVLFILPTSCKKQDSDLYNLDREQAEKLFFSNIPLAEPEVSALINDLKKDKGFMEHLPEFVGKNGAPIWNKTVNTFSTVNLRDIASANERRSDVAQQSKGSDQGLFFVPLRKSGAGITAYIVVNKRGAGSYVYQLYNKADLDALEATTAKMKYDLLTVYSVFGHFEKAIEGKDVITISNSAFNNSTIQGSVLSITSIKNNDQAVASGGLARTAERLSVITQPTSGPKCFREEVQVQIVNVYNALTDAIEPQEQLVEVMVRIPCPPTVWGPMGTQEPGPYYPNGIEDPQAGGTDYWYYDGAGNTTCKDCSFQQGMNYQAWWFDYTSAVGEQINNYYYTDEDIAIVTELKQENFADDTYVTSPQGCYGTGRLGNVRWPGTAEHWLIQFDYVNLMPGGLREYSIPGSSSTSPLRRGYADIVNTISNEIFEIKSSVSQSQIQAGRDEVQVYVNKANENCPPSNGGTWSKGVSYGVRYLPNPKNPGMLLRAEQLEPGLIIYSTVSPQSNPGPSIVPLPQNVLERIRDLINYIVKTGADIEASVQAFLRANPWIIPVLKQTAAIIIIATIIEDFATFGLGIADDWASFIIARTLWRAATKIP